MDSAKYIGMDVHKETVSIAVMDSAGKLVMESILETKAATILQFIQGLRGNLHVTFEKGTWAAWLYDLVKPHVTKIVVCDPRKNALLKEGNKSDQIDARKLAELRVGFLRPVYHGVERPTNAERVVAQLSDDQQRSHARHESAQGSLPGLGHCLRRCDRLRTAPSFGMAGQNNGSRRAPSGRVLLPAARCPAGFAPTSAARSFGGESKA